jgi:ribosomal protein S18 acetylase RimI-like enzyme
MVTIRPETAADCAAVANVHIAAWRVGYRGLLPDQVLSDLDLRQWTDRRLEQLADPTSPFRVLVAEVQDEIAGFISFGPWRSDGRREVVDSRIGEILACYVHPAAWGSGVSDALLRAALDQLEQQEVRLWALTGNERALRFYARHGLLPDGVTRAYPSTNIGIDLVTVRCVLLRS